MKYNSDEKPPSEWDGKDKWIFWLFVIIFILLILNISPLELYLLISKPVIHLLNLFF